jgi:pyruvate formate lyase activating enzyme
MADYRRREGTGATEAPAASAAAVPVVEASDDGRDGQDGEVTGFIHSAETTGTVNGPGVRYTLYMSGCPLRCLYCHNPDTWEMRMGEKVHVDQVVDDIGEYIVFLRTTRGGLTTSGGEPLLQPAFLLALYRQVKKRWDLHTALDTSGNLGERATDELLDLTDLVLLDVKSGLPDTYRNVTSAELEPTLEFGRRLAARGNKMWIRYVLVPGYTDAPDNLAATARYVASLGESVERVEILPYHDLGTHKYAELGLAYPLAGVLGPVPEQIAEARAAFTDEGLVVL